VEKEVRHPARHDKDHADARDDEGQEERDERQAREMPAGRGGVLCFRVSFFQFVPIHCSICSSALRSLTRWSRRAKEKIRRDPLSEKDFCKKSWTAFCAADNNELGAPSDAVSNARNGMCFPAKTPRKKRR